MRLLVFVILCIVSLSSSAQYKVDTTIKRTYLRLFEKLPEEVKDKDALEMFAGKPQLGILTYINTDTLNKKDRNVKGAEIMDVVLFDYDPETGESKPNETAPPEEDGILKRSRCFYYVIALLKTTN